jgi:hypothetical protein
MVSNSAKSAEAEKEARINWKYQGRGRPLRAHSFWTGICVYGVLMLVATTPASADGPIGNMLGDPD